MTDTTTNDAANTDEANTDEANTDEANTDDLTALKHLAAGRSIAFAAAASKLSNEEVYALASRHPDWASRTAAIDTLMQRLERAQVDELSGPAKQ